MNIETRNQLIEDNYYDILRMTHSRFRTNRIDDFNGICGLAMVKAADAFDPSRGLEFKYFAVTYCIWDLRAEYHKDRRREELPSSNLEHIPDFPRRFSRDPDKVLEELMEGVVLSERQAYLLRAILIEQRTTVECGKILGVTQQAASQAYCRALDKLAEANNG